LLAGQLSLGSVRLVGWLVQLAQEQRGQRLSGLLGGKRKGEQVGGAESGGLPSGLAKQSPWCDIKFELVAALFIGSHDD